MQLLNGTWKFQYFNSIYDIQDSFFEKNYDTENFDEIQVQSAVSYTHLDVYKRQGFHSLYGVKEENIFILNLTFGSCRSLYGAKKIFHSIVGNNGVRCV